MKCVSRALTCKFKFYPEDRDESMTSLSIFICWKVKNKSDEEVKVGKKYTEQIKKERKEKQRWIEQHRSMMGGEDRNTCSGLLPHPHQFMHLSRSQPANALIHYIASLSLYQRPPRWHVPLPPKCPSLSLERVTSSVTQQLDLSRPPFLSVTCFELLKRPYFSPIFYLLFSRGIVI